MVLPVVLGAARIVVTNPVKMAALAAAAYAWVKGGEGNNKGVLENLKGKWDYATSTDASQIVSDQASRLGRGARAIVSDGLQEVGVSESFANSVTGANSGKFPAAHTDNNSENDFSDMVVGLLEEHGLKALAGGIGLSMLYNWWNSDDEKDKDNKNEGMSLLTKVVLGLVIAGGAYAAYQLYNNNFAIQAGPDHNADHNADLAAQQKNDHTLDHR